VNIAIIGAGIAGVVLADRLRGAGHAVTVFEKSRGAGGRIATRRTDGFAFDHGAPYFTARSDTFRAFLAPLIARGVVAEWQGRFARIGADGVAVPERARAARFVAVPAMNALCKALIADADLRTGVEVAPIRQPGELHDTEGNGLGRFDWIISTAPGPQTGALFADVASVPLAPNHMSGGFTTMLGCAESHDPGWDMAHVDDAVIGSVIVDSAKPGRDATWPAFVVHAQTDWAGPRIDEDPATIQPVILEGFARLSGIDPNTAQYLATHRWRYAHAGAGLPAGYMVEPAEGVAACGDWCREGGGVEGAFLSARALANRLLDSVG
jgi:predicted NAD/FAD-dependent oxidoreductase